MAPPAPRRRYAPRLPPAQRREQALDAALKLIDDAGYNAVTMEAVAREMGITKPVVYDAFPNRGELLFALLEREEKRAFAAVGPVMVVSEGVDSCAAFVAGLEAFLSGVREAPRAWRLILLPADGTPAVVREHVEQGRAEIRAMLERLVVNGSQERPGPAWADPELVSHAILALGEYGARLVLTDSDTYPPSRLAPFLGQLLAGAGRPA